MKKIVWIGGAILVVVALLVVLNSHDDAGQDTSSKKKSAASFPPVTELTYHIDDRDIPMNRGVFRQDIPNSSLQEHIEITHPSALGDISHDGVRDYVTILKQESGGSGTFFYITAVLADEKDSSKVQTTNSLLIGDRIIPHTIIIDLNGLITLQYYDRGDGEPMTTEPIYLVERNFRIQNQSLIEVFLHDN